MSNPLTVRDLDGLPMSVGHNRALAEALVETVNRLPREDYRAPSGVVTIYVRANGNDETGTGETEETAYRQPQRAYQDIPEGASGTFHIDMGGGNFEMPVWTKRTNGAAIYVIGDRSAPDLELAAPTFTLVAGRRARYRANIGAYGTAVDDDTHWVEGSSLATSHATLDSASPNLDIPGTAQTGTKALHPFATNVAEATGALVVGNLSPTTNVIWVGLVITQATTINNVLMRACKSDFAGALNLKDCSSSNCVFANTSWVLMSGNGTLSGCIMKTLLLFGGDIVLATASLCVWKVASGFHIDYLNTIIPRFGINGADIEGAGSFMRLRYGTAYVKDLKLIGTLAKVFQIEYAGTVILEGAIDGEDPTGDLASLDHGSRIFRLATVAATVTPGGNFAVVGGTTAALVGDLPVKDAASDCFCS